MTSRNHGNKAAVNAETFAWMSGVVSSTVGAQNFSQAFRNTVDFHGNKPMKRKRMGAKHNKVNVITILCNFIDVTNKKHQNVYYKCCSIVFF